MIDKKDFNFSFQDKYEARHLDLYLRIDIDPEIVMDILELTGITRNLKYVDEALSCIISNLYINHNLIMISLDHNIWVKLKKQGIKWASYSTVSKLIKVLLDKNYIFRIKGYYDFINIKKNKNKRSRGKYWLLEKTDFLKSLENKRAYRVEPKNRILILRDKEKYEMRYKKSEKIKNMKIRIRQFNKLINKSKITYNFMLNDLFQNNPNKFQKKLNGLFYLSNSTQISLNIFSTIFNKKKKKKNSNHDSKSNKTNIYINESHNSLRSCVPPLPLLHQDIEMKTDNINKDITYLDDIQKTLNLRGEIFQKSLRRIFNRGDKNFDSGGRFYAPFQNLSSVIRNSFKINNEETVSLDYSGMHIIMLYHKFLNIDYQEECYVYKKEENDLKRTQIKYASLIMINAKSLRSAKEAIYYNLIRKGYSLSRKEICELIEDFKNFHEPIKKYLFSDVGVKLQNYDSTIMDNVLSILAEKNILALPVHDEIIISESHKNLGIEIMKEEYYKVLKFYPTIEVI